MNRKDEWMDLNNELEQIPSELEYLAPKAIARAKKSKIRSRLIKTPLVSFCSVAVLFILLVNLFPTAALAMSNVPILKDLVSAVAYEPSLKAAVDHEYYQVVGESQTQDDITISVEYMILDAGHISIYYKLHAPFDHKNIECEFYDKYGKELKASSSWGDMQVDRLKEVNVDFAEGYTTPDEFVFKFIVKKDSVWNESPNAISSVSPAPYSKEKEITGEREYNFSFLLKPEKKFTQNMNSISINQWITLNGQRILIKNLDIYPTHVKLNFQCDKNNSAVLKELDIYFKDEYGKTYQSRSNGFTAFTDSTTQDINTLFYESSYFSKAKHLTMYIHGIACIDKNKLYGEIDYSKKTISNLPEGITVESMALSGLTLNMITLKADTKQTGCYKQLISSVYYDQEGHSYDLSNIETNTISDDSIYFQRFQIKNYADHKYKVNWDYAPLKTLREPICIELR